MGARTKKTRRQRRKTAGVDQQCSAQRGQQRPFSWKVIVPIKQEACPNAAGASQPSQGTGLALRDHDGGVSMLHGDRDHTADGQLPYSVKRPEKYVFRILADAGQVDHEGQQQDAPQDRRHALVRLERRSDQQRPEDVELLFDTQRPEVQ